MSAIQASLHNFQPSLAFRQSSKGVRQGRSASSDSAISIPNSETMVAAPAFRDEWFLVQQAIGGDSRVQEHIFAPHIGRLQRVALGILHNKEDAEDAVQDALCCAYSKLQSFQGRSTFSTWLNRIVINSALMIRRRRNGRPEDSLEKAFDGRSEPLQLDIADAGPDPEEIFRIAEIQGIVTEQVRQLPPRLREALLLRDLEGLSAAASSQILGIRNSAFKSRVLRARRKLANRLRESFLAPTSRSSETVAEIPSAKIVLSSQRQANASPVFADPSCQ